MRQQSIYNMNPRRFSEIYAEVLQELAPIKEDEVRKEKCALIDDIFRVKKLSQVFNKQHGIDITTNWWDTFNSYYDMTSVELEVELASLSMYLSRYMRQQVLMNNNGDGFWTHLDNNFK